MFLNFLKFMKLIIFCEKHLVLADLRPFSVIFKNQIVRENILG